MKIDLPANKINLAAGKEIPFKGVFVNYQKSGLGAEHFQTIQPGETATTNVNVAKAYNLAGVPKAKINAVQNFLYVPGSEAPASLRDMSLCQASSKSVDIVPDQSKVANDRVSKRETPFSSRIAKRDVSYSSTCTSSQQTTLKKLVTDAINMATAASTASKSAADDFTVWFKSTSKESKVSEHL